MLQHWLVTVWIDSVLCHLKKVICSARLPGLSKGVSYPLQSLTAFFKMYGLPRIDFEMQPTEMMIQVYFVDKRG